MSEETGTALKNYDWLIRSRSLDHVELIWDVVDQAGDSAVIDAPVRKLRDAATEHAVTAQVPAEEGYGKIPMNVVG